MTDEANPGKEKEQGKINSAPTEEIKSLVDKMNKPPRPPSGNEDVGGNPAGDNSCTQAEKSKEILVRVLEDEELKPFEAQTLSWARAGFYLALATLIIGVLTLAAFYNQLGVMQIQLNDAETDSRISDLRTRQQQQTAQAQVDAIKKQMRQDQRAWMNIQVVQWEFNADQPIKVHPIIVNLGKTPAKRMHGRFVVRKLKDEEPLRFIYDKYPLSEPEGGLMVPNAPLTLFGFQSLQFASGKNAVPLNMGLDDVSEIKDGRAYAVVYGTIEYADIFDRNHWIRFCSYTSGDMHRVQPFVKGCSAYNGVDEDQ